MTIKRNYSYVLSLLISVLFVSCWDNFEERSYYSANIDKFSFSAHDTCPGIENFVFNIDQYHGVAADSTTGTIQNLDSLPFGRVVNTLYPSITFQSTNGNIYINDSLWEDGDSIDFSSPVVIKNTSYDGVYTKSYTVKINVHQVDPDSMSLEQQPSTLPAVASLNKLIEMNGILYDYSPKPGGGLQLFKSADSCKTWIAQIVTGLAGEMNVSTLSTFHSKYFVVSQNHQLFQSPDGMNWSSFNPISADGNAISIIALFGDINRKYINEPVPSYLAGMVATSTGDTCFARSEDGTTWTVGSKVPTSFPILDYSLVKSTTATGVQFYTLAGGVNTFGNLVNGVWTTENGINWIQINDGSLYYNCLPSRKNASLFNYDGYLVSLGGVDQDGNLYRDLYISPDHGKTWKEADDNWQFLKMDDGLSGAGVYVQHIPDLIYEKDREFIWIVGGTNSIGATNSIWKAYLNKMIFARR